MTEEERRVKELIETLVENLEYGQSLKGINITNTLLKFLITKDYEILENLCISNHQRESVNILKKEINTLSTNSLNVISKALLIEIEKKIEDQKKQAFISGENKTVTNIELLETGNKTLQEKLTEMNTKRNKNIIYFAVYAILLVVSILLSLKFIEGNNKDSGRSVSISYNIGEILAGAGIALAGIAYASKTLRED